MYWIRLLCFTNTFLLFILLKSNSKISSSNTHTHRKTFENLSQGHPYTQTNTGPNDKDLGHVFTERRKSIVGLLDMWKIAPPRHGNWDKIVDSCWSPGVGGNISHKELFNNILVVDRSCRTLQSLRSLREWRRKSRETSSAVRSQCTGFRWHKYPWNLRGYYSTNLFASFSICR